MTVRVLADDGWADLLADWASERDDMEVVGVITGQYDPERSLVAFASVTFCDNIHPHPERAFRVDPFDFLMAEAEAAQRGLEVVGIFHSHLGDSTTPSRRDQLAMRQTHVPHWWVWPIYSLAEDELRVWTINPAGLVCELAV